MALSTKDVKVGGGMPKTLQPGNVVCKINNIATRPFTFKEGALELILQLETEPLPDFEGFLIDKDKADGPRYKGQVGTVKATEWAYENGITKSGVVVDRDNEIIKFLGNLCVALGDKNWIHNADGKYNTIEEFVEAFNKSGLFKDIYLEFCIAGKEYQNKNNYTNYELFLPRYSKTDGAQFGPVLKDPTKSKVARFNPDTHIKKKKVETVQEFGPDSTTLDTDSAPLDAEEPFQL